MVKKQGKRGKFHCTLGKKYHFQACDKCLESLNHSRTAPFLDSRRDSRTKWSKFKDKFWLIINNSDHILGSNSEQWATDLSDYIPSKVKLETKKKIALSWVRSTLNVHSKSLTSPIFLKFYGAVHLAIKSWHTNFENDRITFRPFLADLREPLPAYQKRG